LINFKNFLTLINEAVKFLKVTDTTTVKWLCHALSPHCHLPFSFTNAAVVSRDTCSDMVKVTVKI